MIYNNLFQIYILIALSVMLHELAHCIVALWLGVKDIKINIGDEFFSITIGRLRFSPLVFNGNVDVDEESLVSNTKIGIVLFFISGNIANVLIIIVCSFFVSVSDYFAILMQINMILIISNSLPVLGTDINKIRYYLKLKRNE